MNLLALDCSTSLGGLALIKNGSLASSLCWWRNKSHSEMMGAAIENTLKKAQLLPKDLNLVATNHGPGSFTGVRVAINTVRALGYANDLPVYSTNTLDLIARGAAPHYSGPILCALNAFKNMVYFAVYELSNDRFRALQAPSVCGIEQLSEQIQAPCLALGDAFIHYAKYFNQNSKFIRRQGLSDYPSAVGLARIAAQDNSRALHWKQIKPLYLRGSEAEEKLKEGLLRPIKKLN